MNGFEAALQQKRQAEQLRSVLALWEGRENDWKSGAATSADTKDRMLDVIDTLNVKLCDDVIEGMTTDLYDFECAGMSVTACATFAVQQVRDYQDAVNT